MAKKTSRRLAGDGGLYQRANGLWVVTMELGFNTNGTRKRWSATSRTQAGAREKLRAATKEIDTHGAITSQTLTVAEWCSTWLRDIVKPRVKPRTFEWYQSEVVHHIVPRIGKVRLANLTPASIRSMEAAIAREVSPASAQAVHRVIRAALTDAIVDGHVVRNVATPVTPPRSLAVEREALSAIEAARIMAATAGDPMGSRWAFALLTGVRQGESLGLQWDRVDLGAGVVDISWQLQRLRFTHGCKEVNGVPSCGCKRAGSCPKRCLDMPAGFEHDVLDGGLVLTRPKTNQGKRLIPMPPMLTEALRTHRKRTLTGGGHNLVWTRDGGRPIDPKDDSKAWDAMVKDVGVRDVPLHSARHTTATLLMELGVDAHVIKGVLGHTNIATTRGYQHVDLALAREAMDKLGEVLS